MEITFHLNTGDMVVLDLEYLSEVHAVSGQQGWLWDKNGAGVDLSAVVAIVPGNTASGDPIYPERITDGDGDEWEHLGEGEYNRNGYSDSYTNIRKKYGIQEHGR